MFGFFDIAKFKDQNTILDAFRACKMEKIRTLQAAVLLLKKLEVVAEDAHISIPNVGFIDQTLAAQILVSHHYPPPER